MGKEEEEEEKKLSGNGSETPSDAHKGLTKKRKNNIILFECTVRLKPFRTTRQGRFHDAFSHGDTASAAEGRGIV